LAQGFEVGFSVSARTESFRKKYLQLLGASSAKDLEEQIVGTVVRALRDGPKANLPVRLSRVARQFKIRPRPELISGAHDGEITFEAAPGEFIIKLCSEGGTSLSDTSPGPRMRFTYAHEFAHRFFYVESGEKWERALNVVTKDLEVAEQMRHRITLRNTEEGLCNRIARRLLIPDDFVAENCPTGKWFAKGETFFTQLTTVARSLGVSRDCLLVRLQDAVSERTSNCALIVGYSKGPITQRSASKLRIISGLFPSSLGPAAPRQFYPGAEWAKFGEVAFNFVASRLQAGRPASSDATLHLRVRGRDADLALRGWSRIISAQSILIWGQLT
jgi:hypothetical protein